MKIYSIVETKTFCGGLMGGKKNQNTDPKTIVRYSCTDYTCCLNKLYSIALSYTKNDESVNSFYNKKGADYYLPDRKGHYNVALSIVESSLEFNSCHDDELTDVIGGIYDRIAKLAIGAGEKTIADDGLAHYSIPFDSDLAETENGFSEILTESGYYVSGIDYESYDNGKGENGNITIEVDNKAIMDIAALPDIAVCQIADYLESYYERHKDDRL